MTSSRNAADTFRLHNDRRRARTVQVNALTSTVLRASLIMNSRPPNTACDELQASMSESLSSESLRETTTVLCLGSWTDR